MRGAKPKPKWMKVIEGDPGKRLTGDLGARARGWGGESDRSDTSDPSDGMDRAEGWKRKPAKPRTPPAMGVIARGAWERLCQVLGDLRVLDQADRDAMEGYCAAYEQYRIAKREVLKLGQVWTGKGGYPVQRPEVAIMKHNLALMLRYLEHFGLTPLARARLHIEPAEEEEEELLD